MAMRQRIIAAFLTTILSAGSVLVPCAAFPAYISAEQLDGSPADGPVIESTTLENADSSGTASETTEEAEKSKDSKAEKYDGTIVITGEAAEVLANYGIDTSTFSLPSDKAAHLLNYLVKSVDSADIEKLKENLGIIEEVLSSPDFQGFFQYQEVRDLLLEIIASTVDFAYSDQALCEKILVTLGLDQSMSEVLLRALVYSGITGNDIRHMPADEKALYDFQQLTTVAIAVLGESQEMMHGVEVIREGGAGL